MKEILYEIKENRLYDICADNHVISDLALYTETSRDIVIIYEIIWNVCSKSANIWSYTWKILVRTQL